MKGKVRIEYLRWGEAPARGEPDGRRWRATLIYGAAVRSYIHADGATREEARDEAVRRFIDMPEPDEFEVDYKERDRDS
jgi:hypothetical protein